MRHRKCTQSRGLAADRSGVSSSPAALAACAARCRTRGASAGTNGFASHHTSAGSVSAFEQTKRKMFTENHWKLHTASA